MDNNINNNILSLKAFADEKEIIHLIAGERVKYVRKCDIFREYHDNDNESDSKNKPVINLELDAMTPPYRYWRKFGNTGWKGGNAKYKVLRKGLEKMMLSDLHKEDSPSYVSQLKSFIGIIQQISSRGEFNFDKPIVLAQLKDKEANIYRPVSTYRDLKTKMVIALLSDYLSTIFDPYFHEEMLAFRKPREYHGRKRTVTTNHDALERILEYRTAHDGKNIWVSECDIQKFFDSIDHEVVMNAFDRMAIIASKEHPEIDLNSARRLLTSFCSSYNFMEDVFSKNDNTDYWKSTLGERWHDGMKCHFAWFEKIPKNHERMGIPQGASLSTIITNMVLSSVDENIINNEDSDRLFIRYCDDIVLMHTSKKTITSLSDEYRNALERHLLPYHPFRDVDNSDLKGGYWNHCKSKEPYLWGKGEGNASEWIGFLGFEIHRNGNVRIRKSSLEKKHDKIFKDYKQILTGKKKDHRERRLKAFSEISIAVPESGCHKRNLLQSHNGITKNPYTNRQIKALRRSRQNCLKRLLK